MVTKRIVIKKKAIATFGIMMFLAMVAFAGFRPAVATAAPQPASILPTITIEPPEITLFRTRTITVTLPRATTTVTKTVVKRIPVVRTATVVRTAPAKPAVTRTVSSTVTDTSTSTQRLTDTVTKTATVTQKAKSTPQATVTDVVEGPEIVKLTKAKAAGISIGLLIIGIILGVITILIMYALGYLDADRKNKEFLEDMLDETHKV